MILSDLTIVVDVRVVAGFSALARERVFQRFIEELFDIGGEQIGLVIRISGLALTSN